jgi:hypothetical protein
MKKDFHTHVEVTHYSEEWDNETEKYLTVLQRRLVPKKGAILSESRDNDGTKYVILEYCYFGDGPSFRIEGTYEELRELFTGKPTVPDVGQLPPGWEGPLEPDWEKAFPGISPQEERHQEGHSVERALADEAHLAAELPGRVPEPRG